VIKGKSAIIMRKGRDGRLLGCFEAALMKDAIEPVVYQAHNQKDQNNDIEEDDAWRGYVV
jgi:hypothetical protein